MNRLFFLFALFFSLVSGPVWADGLSVASWNIKRFGHGEKDLQAVSEVVRLFDLVALQEVMRPGSVSALVKELEKSTGEDWDFLNSHLIGRGSYKEAYSFVFRTTTVELNDGLGQAVVYLDSNDIFAREPFSASFRDKTSGDTFVLASVHILYGKRVADRLPEIAHLDEYWKWLEQVYDDQPVVLAGDFNLQPDHAAFQELRQLGVDPLITNGATTLSSHQGKFANLYDNLWINPTKYELLPVARSGIFNFPSYLGISHSAARKSVSDHAPVFLQTRNAVLHSRH